MAITPPAGLPASGNIADVDPMSGTLQRRGGGTQFDEGVNIARITVTPSYAAKVRIMIAWTNASLSHEALGNANAFVRIGIYHPVSMSTTNDSSGPCTSHVKEGPYVTIYDNQLGTTTPICVALDTAATGTSSLVEDGKLLLSRQQISGFLEPSIPAPASALNTTCTTTTSPWCQAFSSPGQAVYYVVAEMFAPGGGEIPNHVGSLQFYVKANARP